MLETPKFLSYSLGVISLGASIYAASLFGSGQSLERYWWGAVGFGFGSWCLYENRQAIQEQWEDDVLLDADRKMFVHRQSTAMQRIMAPPAPAQMVSLPPVNLSPEIAEGTIDGLVRDKKSTVLSAIPGTTKTTMSLAWMWKLHELFPKAEVYVACVKNDKFLGLAELPGRVSVCHSGEKLLAAVKVVSDILEERTKTPEDQRDFDDKPVRLFMDDFTNLVSKIKDNAKQFKQFKQYLNFISTVGREFQVAYFVSAHSLNLDQLGLEAADIRDCLNVCSLGFESKSANGSTGGGYDSIRSVLYRDAVVRSNDRELLLSQMPGLVEQSRALSRPIFFTTLGTSPSLSLLPDLRWASKKRLPFVPTQSPNDVVVELEAYSEPVEPGEPQSEIARSLLEKLVKVEVVDSHKAELPEHLRAIVDYSEKKGWISARDLKQNKRTFKSVSSEQIKEYFAELLALGIGAIRGGEDSLEYNANPYL